MILELKSYLQQDIKSKCEILLFIKSRRHNFKSLLAPLSDIYSLYLFSVDFNLMHLSLL